VQPVVYLAVVGVAIATLGVGFLDNQIDLTDMVQQFGAGEQTIQSPITSAYIDWKIEKTVGLVAMNGEEVRVFKNIITECIVQADKKIVRDSTIICKLTDINGNVVIEGQKRLVTFLSTRVFTVIPIIDNSLEGKNLVSNIHDVQLVVIGPSALVPTP